MTDTRLDALRELLRRDAEEVEPTLWDRLRDWWQWLTPTRLRRVG